MLLNNRYQIIQTLGSGGFGDTFLAEDTQMPSQRRCVIKQLKPIENNPAIYQLVQERFAREAAILEELGGISQQIPTLYAYFNLEEKFYLVQEWVEGNTITAVFCLSYNSYIVSGLFIAISNRIILFCGIAIVNPC